VIILDSIEEHASLLLDRLRDADIDAWAFQTIQRLVEFMGTQPINLAVLVLHSSAWWKDELRLFCNSIRYRQQRPDPEILCILSWPPKDLEEEAMNRVSGDALRADVRHE
jgi:hypothetical protein